MFNKLQNTKCLVKCTGGFKVLEMYEYKECLYVKNGMYYLKLLGSGLTSNNNIMWVEIQGIEYVNKSGYIQKK